jgi:hypothetical protein
MITCAGISSNQQRIDLKGLGTLLQRKAGTTDSALQDDIALTVRRMQQLGKDILLPDGRCLLSSAAGYGMGERSGFQTAEEQIAKRKRKSVWRVQTHWSSAAGLPD